MSENLRKLLIQRAARLQERSALTSSSWGLLNYNQFRNRVEGVALGLSATTCPVGTGVFCATGTPWDWASEVAAACCGLRWERSGAIVNTEILGGSGFNDEHGRGPYHEREQEVNGGTIFAGSLDHAAVMLKLQRMNRILGWDHETEVSFPLALIGISPVRAGLWCALYAGSHAILEDEPTLSKGIINRRMAQRAAFDPAPFSEFWGLS
jgi:hypothetical protein